MDDNIAVVTRVVNRWITAKNLDRFSEGGASEEFDLAGSHAAEI
jgi:hypothetical protein